MKKVAEHGDIPHNNLEVEYGEQAYDYPEYLFTFSQDLKTDLQLNNGQLFFGQDFKAKTSKGLDIIVKTVYCDRPVSSAQDKFYKQQKIYFIATDNHGKLLGHRKQDLFFYHPSDEHKFQLESLGTVATRFRDLGISTVIDTAHIAMMQKKVNSLGEGAKLRWVLVNGNEDDLFQLRTPASKSLGLEQEGLSMEERAVLIEKKEAEQKRWQALYGLQGKFGATPTASNLITNERVFEAREVAEDKGLVGVASTQENQDFLKNILEQIQEILDKAQKNK